MPGWGGEEGIKKTFHSGEDSPSISSSSPQLPNQQLWVILPYSLATKFREPKVGPMLGFLDISPAPVLRNKVLTRSNFMWLWANCGLGPPITQFPHTSLTSTWACSLSSKNVFSYSSLGLYARKRPQSEMRPRSTSTRGPGWEGKCWAWLWSSLCYWQAVWPGEVTSTISHGFLIRSKREGEN